MQISSSRFQPRTSHNGAQFRDMSGRRVDSLTDKERDEIDYEANAIIRQTMNQVKVIEHREEGMCDWRREHWCVERRARIEKSGFLERMMTTPEEEARNTLLSTHRGAVSWYLSKKLKETSDIQRYQQEVRLEREVEKSKRQSSSFPWVNGSMVTRPSKPSSTAPKVSREYEKEEEFEATLSKEQLQVLEQENNSLLEGFEQMLDKIK